MRVLEAGAPAGERRVRARSASARAGAREERPDHAARDARPRRTRYRRGVRAAHVTELSSPPEPVEVEPAPAAAPRSRSRRWRSTRSTSRSAAASSTAGIRRSRTCPAARRWDAVKTARSSISSATAAGSAKPGFLAERVDVPDDLPLRLPEGVDPALAAAAGIAGVAAWVPVAWQAKVTAGRSRARARRYRCSRPDRGPGRHAARRREGRRRRARGDARPTDRRRVRRRRLHGLHRPASGASRSRTRSQFAAPRARIVHLGQSAGPESPLALGGRARQGS